MADPYKSKSGLVDDGMTLRRIWEPEHGDGDSTEHVIQRVIKTAKGHPTWKIFAQDTLHCKEDGSKQEPPRYVYLDDKACYTIWKSKQYTHEEMRLFWPFDFDHQGNIKASRPNRGRPAWEDENAGIYAKGSLRLKGQQYKFSGAPIMTEYKPKRPRSMLGQLPQTGAEHASQVERTERMDQTAVEDASTESPIDSIIRTQFIEASAKATGVSIEPSIDAVISTQSMDMSVDAGVTAASPTVSARALSPARPQPKSVKPQMQTPKRRHRFGPFEVSSSPDSPSNSNTILPFPGTLSQKYEPEVFAISSSSPESPSKGNDTVPTAKPQMQTPNRRHKYGPFEVSSSSPDSPSKSYTILPISKAPLRKHKPELFVISSSSPNSSSKGDDTKTTTDTLSRRQSGPIVISSSDPDSPTKVLPLSAASSRKRKRGPFEISSSSPDSPSKGKSTISVTRTPSRKRKIGPFELSSSESSPSTPFEKRMRLGAGRSPRRVSPSKPVRKAITIKSLRNVDDDEIDNVNEADDEHEDEEPIFQAKIEGCLPIRRSRSYSHSDESSTEQAHV